MVKKEYAIKLYKKLKVERLINKVLILILIVITINSVEVNKAEQVSEIQKEEEVTILDSSDTMFTILEDKELYKLPPLPKVKM